MTDFKRAGADHEDLTLQDASTTHNVAALGHLARLSQLGAVTRETVDHLRDLADLCGEANSTIASIRQNLASGDAVEDPAKMAEILNKLSSITDSVEDVNRRADARVIEFRKAAGQ